MRARCTPTWPLAALIPSLALTACLRGPSADVIDDVRTAAVGFALTERATIVSLARRCQFDPETRQSLAPRARAAVEAWSDRNQPVVDAANAYLEDYFAVLARRSGRGAAADEESALTRQYGDRGTEIARRMLEERGGPARCPELLAEVERGDLDLESPELDPVLEELVERYAPAD